jgi:hypothetical protein
VGCIEPSSIVVTSVGVFFQSARGVELLDRNQTVSFVGESVQDTIAAFPVISSAVLDERNALVRFTLAASVTAGVVSALGRDLVFDLTLKTWISVDSKLGADDNEAAQSAALVLLDDEWRYAWLGPDGTLYSERDANDEDAHLDGSGWITQRAITSWVHIAGIQGEQFIDQVLLLAQQTTAHDVIISIAFDYVDSYTSTKTFTSDVIATLAREWLVKEVGQTTSNAIRVKVEDATPSVGDVGRGKGGTWLCLTMSGQPHRGPKRSSSAQRGGA